MPPAATRYLYVRPRGITHWMSQAPDMRQPDQRLLRYLAQRPAHTVPVDVERLSQGTGLARRQVAQSLFSLHRLRGIGVATGEAAQAPAEAPPAARLHAQLRRLCQSGRSAAAVLADPDGLCMASHGMPPGAAEAVAAGVPSLVAPPASAQVLPLYVGRHRPCRLHCAGLLALEQEALVRLVQALHELLEDGGDCPPAPG